MALQGLVTHSHRIHTEKFSIHTTGAQDRPNGLCVTRATVLPPESPDLQHQRRCSFVSAGIKLTSNMREMCVEILQIRYKSHPTLAKINGREKQR